MIIRLFVNSLRSLTVTTVHFRGAVQFQDHHSADEHKDSSSGILKSEPEMNISYSEYPFFVALWNKGIHICGASILTKDMILTAAHCVYNIVNPMDMEAFFGVSSKTEILNKDRFMIVQVKVNLET